MIVCLHRFPALLTARAWSGLTAPSTLLPQAAAEVSSAPIETQPVYAQEPVEIGEVFSLSASDFVPVCKLHLTLKRSVMRL